MSARLGCRMSLYYDVPVFDSSELGIRSMIEILHDLTYQHPPEEWLYSMYAVMQDFYHLEDRASGEDVGSSDFVCSRPDGSVPLEVIGACADSRSCPRGSKYSNIEVVGSSTVPIMPVGTLYHHTWVVGPAVWFVRAFQHRGLQWQDPHSGPT